MEFDLIITFRIFCKEALLCRVSVTHISCRFYGIDLGTFAPRFVWFPWMQHGHILKHIADVGGQNLKHPQIRMSAFSNILLRLKASLAV